MVSNVLFCWLIGNSEPFFDNISYNIFDKELYEH